MGVYDFNGNELTTIYDFTGVELVIAYDYSGNEIFTGFEPTTIDEVSKIFQQSCLDAVEYLDSLGDGYYNYVVRADTHYPLNFCHSGMICNYLFSNAKINKLINLGDFVNDINIGDDGWETVVNDGTLRYKNQTLFAQGNHDSHLIPLSAVEEILLPTSVHHAVDSTYNPPYYWDDKKAKIRFIVTHHGSNYNANEVYNWIRYRPDGYKWAKLSHYTLANNNSGGLYDLIDEGGFVGNFCGHEHFDRLDSFQTATGTSFYNMTFDCDASGGQSDDINGQVVTIMSINPTTENVKFYRIGRSSVYESKQWEYTGFTK